MKIIKYFLFLGIVALSQHAFFAKEAYSISRFPLKPMLRAHDNNKRESLASGTTMINYFHVRNATKDIGLSGNHSGAAGSGQWLRRYMPQVKDTYNFCFKRFEAVLKKVELWLAFKRVHKAMPLQNSKNQ